MRPDYIGKLTTYAGRAAAACVLASSLLVPAAADAQATVIPIPYPSFENSAGTGPCASCRLYAYAAGTSTLLSTYSDSALTVANVNPLVLNAAGRNPAGAIYLLPRSYKFVLQTSAGTEIWSRDNIAALPPFFVNLDVTGTAGEALSAGDVVYLSDGSGSLTAGRWYKADADNTYSSSTAGMVGIAPAACASGATDCSIRMGGRVTGLSGLTAGELYYASATAAALTATPPTNTRFVGEADSTTSLIVQGNPGGVRVPDSDGTHSLVVKTTSDLTADRLLTFVTGDAARTITITGDATIGAAVPLNTMEGRLTLTTGTPVTTADVTAATTLYYALYKGSRVTLYTGSAWTTVAIAQLSIAVPATTSTMYDVFIDYTAGVPVLELVAWTNDTTRAVALATQDGVYVQTSDADSRYVGSFRTTGVSGQTEDSAAKRYVWNYYNRVERSMLVLEATDSWTYDGVFRQARASSANQLDFVIGVSEDIVEADVMAIVQAPSAQNAYAGIGLDSTSANATGVRRAKNQSDGNFTGPALASWRGTVAVGRHVLVWLESASAATTTWIGDDGGTNSQSGISGTVWG